MGRLANPVSRERNYGMEILRIVASFLVVLGHVVAYLYSDDNVHSALFCSGAFYRTLGRVPVPLFVMVSGAFLLDPKRDFSFKKFITRNLVHVAVPFLFWSFLYSVYDVVSNGTGFSVKSAFSFVFTVLLGIHHLWYLPMLIGLYLLVPLLRKICESETLMRYFIALSFLFGFVAHFLERMPIASEMLYPIFEAFELRFVTGYVGYFVLGYYALSHDFSRKSRILIYCAGFAGAAVTIAGIYILSFRAQELRTILSDYLFPNLFLWVFALFLLFKEINRRFSFSDAARKILTDWSSLTFGIYLAHLFMIFAIGRLIPTIRLPVLTIPAVSILCYVLSMAITFILKKIPVLNRYVV